ncbi:MAG TPA: pyruvate, phosphate dikinase [Polyangiales bacterium]|nr:pyruvate, phosphate dikinase [Polyangiales bacterium]
MTLLYPFDAELDSDVRLQLLGKKAAGLQEMSLLGIPVPPGFTITTEVGNQFRKTARWPDGLDAAIEQALRSIEARMGRGFGAADQPLLLSVRSGAPVSMPGMMDTLLNVGLSEGTLSGLAAQRGGERFALDSYRRLLQMYGAIVRGIGADRFQRLLSDLKTKLGYPRMLDSEIPVVALEELVAAYLSLIDEASGSPFPQDVDTQLWDAIGAVFASWDNPRATRYRRMQRIDRASGTACIVQAMVFGNAGARSGSGVAFTRNPSNGDKQLYGEFLPNAQGEDVVSGMRTPVALTKSAAAPGKEGFTLEASLPEAFEAISSYCASLEKHFGDMQDIEFTIEEGLPYLLQTRTAKRAAKAAVRIAVDMVKEGVLSKEDALLRVDARSLEQLLRARLPSDAELSAQGVEALTVGLPAGPGAASGRIVFGPDEAVRWAAEGQDVILIRQETRADDIHGMKAAKGVVTAAGGMTSHAAVVARGLGKCCVVGCADLEIDVERRTVRLAGAYSSEPLREGDLLTLDGTNGKVYSGALDLVASATVDELQELMSWADEVRRMQVYAEADTPQTARAALSYGAQGVGLCRTERMFFAQDRLFAMRCALLSVEDDQRSKWLSDLGRAQEEDFAEIFRAMDGRPVTIRLLDRALGEFLPEDETALRAVADALDLELDEVITAAARHRESNPAFGHRGVRAGLTIPGLYEMQLRAMLVAARTCTDAGVPVELEVLIPMVSYSSEVEAVRAVLARVRDQVFVESTSLFTCRVGVMIELPRACLIADELAELTDFFSFGGNDLTQTTLGISREDAGRFLPSYLNELGMMENDPFNCLDARVAELMQIALERAKRRNQSLIAGLCGDQGGSPATIAICERLGLDFVSAPLSQIPGARLAAAQARLR